MLLHILHSGSLLVQTIVIPLATSQNWLAGSHQFHPNVKNMLPFHQVKNNNSIQLSLQLSHPLFCFTRQNSCWLYIHFSESDLQIVMNPRAPHLDEEHEPTTLDCLKVFYDKCCRDYAELTESELLRLAASLLIGAATFPVCLGVFQKLVFTPLKISNVSIGSDMLGMCVVAVSGITATHFTSRVWEFLTGKKFHILFEYAILNPQYVLLLTVYIFRYYCVVNHHTITRK